MIGTLPEGRYLVIFEDEQGKVLASTWMKLLPQRRLAMPGFSDCAWRVGEDDVSAISDAFEEYCLTRAFPDELVYRRTKQCGDGFRPFHQPSEFSIARR